MALNTPHNVTLTEGQIGVIFCSLESSVKYADSEYIEEVDTIFNILEGSVDKYYAFYPYDVEVDGKLYSYDEYMAIIHPEVII